MWFHGSSQEMLPKTCISESWLTRNLEGFLPNHQSQPAERYDLPQNTHYVVIGEAVKTILPPNSGKRTCKSQPAVPRCKPQLRAHMNGKTHTRYSQVAMLECKPLPQGTPHVTTPVRQHCTRNVTANPPTNHRTKASNPA